MNTFKFMVATLLGLATLTPAFALAVDVTGNASVTAQANTTGVSANASSTVRLGAAETKAKERAAQEIDRRIKALTDLNTRVQQTQKLSDAFKASLNTNIQSEISGLTSLKTKIGADADVATLKADVKTITDSYRIFALVIPQGRISAAADRVAVIVDMMGITGTKLQARLQTAAQAGSDVTALNTSLTDLAAKIQEAQTKAQDALTKIGSLAPDNGDKAVMTANTKALADARTDLGAANKALITARKDIETIVKGLGSLKASVNASSTTP